LREDFSPLKIQLGKILMILKEIKSGSYIMAQAIPSHITDLIPKFLIADSQSQLSFIEIKSPQCFPLIFRQEIVFKAFYFLLLPKVSLWSFALGNGTRIWSPRGVRWH
jgi:hypothetical protein